jgi:hypothetical protein
MTTITVLHLTDIHFGQSLMTSSWTMLKAELVRDLDHMIDEVGSIDLIAFTGDLAFSGMEDQYRRVDEFLEELGLYFLERSDSLPLLAAVPGNHDLQRPPAKSLPARVLQWQWDTDLEQDLLTDPYGELAEFLHDTFRAYSSWAKRSVLPWPEIDSLGALPGEYSAHFSKDGVRFGLIGLNSSFRHLSDGVSEGGLTVSGQQIQAACGGDLPRWASQQDVVAVLTHHPVEWLSDPGEFSSNLFAPTTPVRIHLCGHLHAENYRLVAAGSEAPYVIHQGLSLFGLERYGPASNEVDRRHGYALLSADLDGDSVAVRVRPRKAYREAGYWSLERDPGFGLPKGSTVSNPVELPVALRVLNERRDVTASLPSSNGTVSVPLDTSIERRGEQTSERAKDLFLERLATGDLIVILGDRILTSPSEPPEKSDTPLSPGLAHCESMRWELWTALYPGVLDDGSQPWDELVAVAAARIPDKLNELTQGYLRSPSKASIDEMASILSAPWARLFYLSPQEDFWEARERVPSQLHRPFLDATKDPYRLPLPGITPAIQLSGHVAGNGIHKVKWEPARHGTTGSVAEWHGYATRLIPRSPVLFLADSMRSLSLWQYVTCRGTTLDSLRPPAFLVTPTLSEHQAAVLDLYSLHWIKSDVSSFIKTYLVSSRQEYADGIRRVTARQTARVTSIRTIAELRRDAGAGSRDYLYGREPTWGDIIDGYAARLQALNHFRLLVLGEPTRIHILIGTAGAGRTSLLMQLALELEANHNRVGWISRSTNARIETLLETVDQESLDAIVIDDPDIFGIEAGRLLERLHENGARLVVAGVRSVRADLVAFARGANTWSMPNLTLDDIDAIVAKLRGHKALADRRMTRPGLVKLFRDEASQQLLVGMIRATSGLSLREKVASECAQLSRGQLKMYGCLALLTTERESMSHEEVMEAANDLANSSRTFDALRSAKLVIEQQPELFAVRHRVIAEAVVDYLRSHALLREVVEDCLKTFAALAADLRDATRRERRIMVRLLNHTYL